MPEPTVPAPPTAPEADVCGFRHDQWDGPYNMRRRCTAPAGHATGQFAYDHGPWEAVPAPEPSTCTCTGTGLNACAACPTPWPELPGAIRMTRPEDVAAGIAPAWTVSAIPADEPANSPCAPVAGLDMDPSDVVAPEPAPDLGPAELTAEEARALAEELGQDLYEAQDALSFVAECCDVADRTGESVTTARVRTWLEGAKCGRVIMGERGRSITEVAAGDGTNCACPCQGCAHWCAGHPDPGRCLGQQLADIAGAVPSQVSRMLTAVEAHHAPAPSASRDTMREAIAGAIDTVFEQWTAGLGENRPQDALADAVMAVRDGELQQLRADLAAARATNQRLNYRAQTAESRLNTVTVAVANWEINERGTYVPLSTLNAIAKAVGIHYDTDGWELHYQRVDALETTIRDYENRLTWETTCGEHAKLLDACRAADEAREEAEAEVARVTDLMGRYADRGITNGQRAEAAEAKVAAAQSARDSAAASAATLLSGVIRVRQMIDAWEQQLPEMIRTATAVDAIRTALTAPHGPAEQGDGGGTQ